MDLRTDQIVCAGEFPTLTSTTPTDFPWAWVDRDTIVIQTPSRGAYTWQPFEGPHYTRLFTIDKALNLEAGMAIAPNAQHDRWLVGGYNKGDEMTGPARWVLYSDNGTPLREFDCECVTMSTVKLREDRFCTVIATSTVDPDDDLKVITHFALVDYIFITF